MTQLAQLRPRTVTVVSRDMAVEATLDLVDVAATARDMLVLAGDPMDR
jgi:hypothetical protein